jgi:hypothetical protein
MNRDLVVQNCCVQTSTVVTTSTVTRLPRSTMSPVLPFDIIALIIDIVGESKDTRLLKELTLVSQSFLQICSKHLFATVELHDAQADRDFLNGHVTCSKKRFVELLKSRPDVVEYIRKLMYNVNDDDHLLSPILPNFLRTISRLNSLTIVGSLLDWNTLDSSLTSALLHLMHLPTINHIYLSYIQNFPLSGLPPSINLLRLDKCLHERDGSPEIVVQSEMMPKICKLQTSGSALLTTKLLHAERQDGRPAFNFMDLRQLSIDFEDKQNIRYLLQNAKLLEKLHLTVKRGRLWGLHDILFPPIACALKFLDLKIYTCGLQLPGLCEELEAMAGQYELEALSIEIYLDGHGEEDSIGSIIQNVEKILVKPGWSALRQVTFKVVIGILGNGVKLYETLQSSLPDKYFSYFLKFVAFSETIYVVQCTFKF